MGAISRSISTEQKLALIYTSIFSDVSCPPRPLQRGCVQKNCLPSFFSRPVQEEGRNSKRIETPPLGPKDCKQFFKFNCLVTKVNLIVCTKFSTAGFASAKSILTGLWRNCTKEQKYPYCPHQQPILCPAAPTHFCAAPVQRYLHELR